MKHRNSTLLEVLSELQALDRVPRIGFSLRGVAEPESVSEHAFHTAFVAWTLACEEPELDRLRVLELALVHDLAEVRTGDLPRNAAAYFPRGAKAQAELAIAQDLLAPLGDRAVERFAEYQEQATREARFVKICDKLQLLIKASVYRSWGARGMEEFQANLGTFSDGGYASVAALVGQLEAARSSQPANDA
ncbi:MAG: HD domain-containing protein [Acidobacteriota bacterium]